MLFYHAGKFLNLKKKIKIFFYSLLLFFWGGFITFILFIYSFKQPFPLIVHDAIIVLTGGKNRISSAYHLLEKKISKKLFISGVHKKIDKDTLRQEIHAQKKFFSCCVDLGNSATNTLQNAIESARWIKNHGYKKIYLVTSDYHMPRSLLEFKTLIPNVTFIPYPVFPEKRNETFLFYWHQRLQLFSIEYLKFIREKIRFLLFPADNFITH